MSEAKTQDWFASFIHAVNNQPSMAYSWITFSVKEGYDMKLALREVSDSLEKTHPGETVSLLSVTRL